MKKSDLKFGNVVELRNGGRYLYTLTDNSQIKFINLEIVDSYVIWKPYRDYKEDLTYSYASTDEDIVRVYEDYTLTKLLWERSNKPNLTDDERAILRNLDKEFKYIARDKNGDLYVYVEAPVKGQEMWKDKDSIILPYEKLFNFIKWEDKLPYEIAELLK